MSCGFTLTDVVERYCIDTYNDHRKNFKHHLVHAKDTWNEVLKRTLHSFRTEWAYTFSATPYPYILIPKEVESLLGVYYKDDCGRLVEVYHSDIYNTTPNKAKKTCTCAADCNCGSVCSEANNYTLITKEHIIDSVPYTERQWVETCKNGDVIIWREVPTKKEDNSVTTIQHRERVCSVTVKPCGCIEETTSNIELLSQYCGCFNTCSSPNIHRLYAKCETVVQREGDRLYFIGRNVKTEYLIQFREHNASENSLVPEHCLMLVKSGIDWHSKAFNPRIRRDDRDAAERNYRKRIVETVEYLNPIDFEFIEFLGSKM